MAGGRHLCLLPRELPVLLLEQADLALELRGSGDLEQLGFLENLRLLPRERFLLLPEHLGVPPEQVGLLEHLRLFPLKLLILLLDQGDLALELRISRLLLLAGGLNLRLLPRELLALLPEKIGLPEHLRLLPYELVVLLVEQGDLALELRTH